MRYVLGLNKYSHDAGCCLLSTDGSHSIVVPNERLSRRKHDGGDTGAAVRHALEASGATLDDVVAVCGNNHHHRIADFERRLPWSVELGLYPKAALAKDNLLPGIPRMELSHHLAHAWSVVAQAPFDEGLVVVMDGMGETHDAMAHHHHLGATGDAYAHDLQLQPCERAGYVQVPRTLQRHVNYREAESVYAFSGSEVCKVFKRWVPIRSPPELYNHGFENLESLGALYSRVSSHVFGDWNACGKVMGLGPWVGRWAPDAHTRGGTIGPLLSGRLEEPDGADVLRLDWETIEQLPHPNGFKATMAAAGDAALDESLEPANVREERAFYAELSARVQTDLEEAALGFLQRLQQRTGHTNLCVVGGVIQNSVLNGRICREAGFTNVFIPPCPGDEGIAIGCAAYAQHVMAADLGLQPPPLRRAPWPAYQGRAYSAAEVANAIEEFAPWVERVPLGDGSAEEVAAQALHNGEVVGWFDGRAEVGARALGHRSLLADPTRADMHRRVNVVKQREQWRPLAPSVLAEHADAWFDGVPACGSPYMSITASVKPEVREKVPAITHVDGSARLQTVDAADAPLYHALILAFFALAGVPMVMNTSFNLANMPIVEVRVEAMCPPRPMSICTRAAHR